MSATPSLNPLLAAGDMQKRQHKAERFHLKYSDQGLHIPRPWLENALA